MGSCYAEHLQADNLPSLHKRYTQPSLCLVYKISLACLHFFLLQYVYWDASIRPGLPKKTSIYILLPV